MVSKFQKMLSTFISLKNYPEDKQGASFLGRIHSLESNLEVGLDLYSEDRIDCLKNDLGIEYGAEERICMKTIVN